MCFTLQITVYFSFNRYGWHWLYWHCNCQDLSHLLLPTMEHGCKHIICSTPSNIRSMQCQSWKVYNTNDAIRQNQMDRQMQHETFIVDFLCIAQCQWPAALHFIKKLIMKICSNSISKQWKKILTLTTYQDASIWMYHQRSLWQLSSGPSHKITEHTIFENKKSALQPVFSLCFNYFINTKHIAKYMLINNKYQHIIIFRSSLETYLLCLAWSP